MQHYHLLACASAENTSWTKSPRYSAGSPPFWPPISRATAGSCILGLPRSLRPHGSRRGYFEACGDLAEPAPCRVFDRDARAAAALLGAVLDLAGVEDFVEAVGRRRGLEVSHEGLDLDFEVGRRERPRIDDQHECAVVVAPLWIDSEAQARKHRGQGLHCKGQPIAFVPFGAAEWQHHSTLELSVRIRGGF